MRIYTAKEEERRTMTLLQLSEEYGGAAELIAGRMALLRQQAALEEEAEHRQRLVRRINDLRPLLRQCRQLQRLTAHYYDRSYYRDEGYRI